MAGMVRYKGLRTSAVGPHEEVWAFQELLFGLSFWSTYFLGAGIQNIGDRLGNLLENTADNYSQHIEI